MECNSKDNQIQINSSSTNNSQNKNNKINNNPNSSFFNINLYKKSSELKIISNISSFFTDVCENNMKGFIKEKNQRIIKPFITINASKTIKDYLEHLYNNAKMNISTIILMIIYIDRLCKMNKIKLTFSIIHKLLLSSLIVAIKYNEDEYNTLKFYAQCGGVSKTELSILEFSFITSIDFNLFVSEDLFNKYYDIFVDEDSFDEYDDDEEEEEEKEHEKETKKEIPKG